MTEVGVVPDHVCGAGVAPCVRGDMFSNSGQQGMAFDEITHRMSVNGIAAEAEEKAVTAMISQKLGTNAFDVSLKEPARHLAQRGQPILAPLAMIDP